MSCHWPGLEEGRGYQVLKQQCFQNGGPVLSNGGKQGAEAILTRFYLCCPHVEGLVYFSASARSQGSRTCIIPALPKAANS